MSCQVHLFLDFDDTLTPMREHRARYVRTLAGLLKERYGGLSEEWECAVRSAMEASIQRYNERFQGCVAEGFRQWLSEEQQRQAQEVIRLACPGRPMHQSILQEGTALQHQALRACSVSYPGASKSLSLLADKGIPIHMASAWDAAYLTAALEGMGLAQYVSYRFGPDLVDYAKEGPEFYRRVFRRCGIRPEDALVLDDQQACLQWAAEVGARPIQARLNAQPQVLDAFIEHMEALPDLVARLGC
ncbi:MAG: HAD family hydrolase [Chthonomonadales bacterium]